MCEGEIDKLLAGVLNKFIACLKARQQFEPL